MPKQIYVNSIPSGLVQTNLSIKSFQKMYGNDKLLAKDFQEQSFLSYCETLVGVLMNEIGILGCV